MTQECPSQWFEVVHRILCDKCPKKVDLIFLHAEVNDNEDSVINAGAKFYSEGFADKIGITWADKSVLDEMLKNYEKFASPELAKKMREALQPAKDGSILGYKGYKYWEQKLIALGVPKKDIIKIKPSYQYWFHTDSESEGLINFCEKNKIKTICICSAPFHQVRSFFSGVSAISRNKCGGIKIYNKPGENLNWNENTVHSQGTVKGTRIEILNEELKRIYRYQQSGNPCLINLKGVLDYLNKRDNKINL